MRMFALGTRVLTVAVVALLTGSPVIAATSDCRADAEVLSAWVEDGGFKQLAKVRVVPDSCERGCNGAVDVVFFYSRKDGWSNSKSTTGLWSMTSRDRAKEVVLDTRAINCSKEKPCEVKEVQIRKVTCR